MGLELRMELIFAGCFLELDVLVSTYSMHTRYHPTHGVVSFKQNNPPSFITRCQIVAGMIKLDGGYDIGWRKTRSVCLCADPRAAGRMVTSGISSYLL